MPKVPILFSAPLLIILTALIAFLAPRSAPAQTMHLHITDQETGAPLPNTAVYVDIYELPDINLKTDANGAVDVIYPPNAASVAVTATADHHVPMTMQWRRAAADQKLLPADFTLAVPTGSHIGGKVIDDAGQPVAGATVRLDAFNSLVRPPRSLGVIDQILTTGPDGTWTFDRAPDPIDILRIGVYHPDYPAGPRAGVFFKDNYFSRIASLRDGSATFTLHRGIKITGTVRDSAGQPIAGAKVGLGPNRTPGNIFPNILTDTAGRFSFGANRGEEVIVTVRAHAYSPDLQTITVADAPQDLSFTLAPGHPLRGRIVDDAGNGIPAAIFVANKWRGKQTIHTEVRADGDGRFTWDSAPDDEVTCDFWKSGYTTITNVPVTAKDGEQTFILHAGPRTTPSARPATPRLPID